MDRLDFLLDNEGTRIAGGNLQGIFPEVGFTCSGSISGWVFGAQWVRQDSLFTELQIWRPTGDGHYTKVGSTTIMTTHSSTQIYYCTLSAPLEFQAGDVLGYHQPSPLETQLRVYFENNGRGQIGYYYLGISAASDLYIEDGTRSDVSQILVNVITGELVSLMYNNCEFVVFCADSSGCVRGFMSVEKIRLLLGRESTSLTSANRRQHLSPEISFTCDGMITKWIIVANSLTGTNNQLFPKLQIWRNVGNDTYHKISGTHIFLPFVPKVLILFLSTVHLIQSQSEQVMFLESSYHTIQTLEFFSCQRAAIIVLVCTTTNLVVPVSLSHLLM